MHVECMTDTDHIKELKERIKRGSDLEGIFAHMESPQANESAPAGNEIAKRLGKTIHPEYDDEESIRYGLNFVKPAFADPNERANLRFALVQPEKLRSVRYVRDNFDDLMGRVREKLAENLIYSISPHDGGNDVYQDRKKGHEEYLEAVAKLEKIAEDPEPEIVKERERVDVSVAKKYADYEAGDFNVLKNLIQSQVGRDLVVEMAQIKAAKAKNGFDSKFSSLDERADYAIENARYILDNDSTQDKSKAYNIAKLLVR